MMELPQKEIRVVWKYNTYGFMDFVRGYICVDQMFGQQCKITPVIDSLHHLSKVFIWANSHLHHERRVIRSEEYSANQWQQHYIPESQFQTLLEKAWLSGLTCGLRRHTKDLPSDVIDRFLFEICLQEG